jgi:carboxyl-terminal processing protease
MFSKKKNIIKGSLYFVIIPALVIIFASYTFCKHEGKEQVLMKMISHTLNLYHFSPKELDDNFSQQVYSQYIKNLDYNKRFFTKADLAGLEVFKTKIDDQIVSGNLDFYNQVTKIYNQNIEKVKGYINEVLSVPFTFSSTEMFESDPDKTDFPADDNALKETWRKSLKYQVLARVSDAIKMQESKKSSKDSVAANITTKTEKDSTIKTFEELEVEARQKVLKTHEDWYKRIKKISESDNFNIFLNSITNVFDPHSQYLPPKDKENFNISMSGQLEGIGALLQEEGNYIKIVSIVPGSPSWFQGDLKAGDIIMKVKQENQEAVDIFDMRLDDVVRIIRGKKGTKVTLTVKKIDNSIKDITITRDVVIVEETYAKSAIIENAKKDKIGYVYLPKFYANFEQTETGRSCSEDVAIEISKLKAENVRGVILDLRNNGGGSLSDAVKMAGLFIKEGPIVQVKDNFNPVKIYTDPDTKIVYDGALVILVNSFSASASEIVAAAMQDYKRAIIMGSPSTFGKGTVQTVIELDNMINSTYQSFKPLGVLLITIQKFYRINGGATQLKGVTPDIILPDPYSEIEIGEREQEYALPWTKINPLTYTTWTGIPKFEQIVQTETKNTLVDPNFKILKEQALQLKKKKDETQIPLNYKLYNNQEKENQEKSKNFDDLMKKQNGLEIKALAADNSKIKNDTVTAARMDNWIKDLKKDIYLSEAVKVIDMINSK